MKRKYEMMFILDVMEAASTKEEVKEILSQHNANILKEEELGVKTLAYSIKKRDKGFYYLLQMELQPSVLKEINNDIRLNENILKYLALILQEKKGKPEKKKDLPPVEAADKPAEDAKAEAVGAQPEEKVVEEIVADS